MVKTSVCLIAGLGLAGFFGELAHSSQAQAPAVASQAPNSSQPQPQPPSTNPEEAGLRAMVEAFSKHFNAGDSKALAALFTENARVVTEDGRKIEGREAIERQFAEAFQGSPGQTIAIKTESLRFLGPDVALEEGTATITTPGTTADSKSLSEKTRYSVVYVRRDGKWLQDSIRDYPAAEASETTAEEHLKELEWLVGEWVDESDEAEVRTTCRWSENKAFLLRAFDVKVRGRSERSGTQRIGWDPRLKQFRSWVFDSDGGFSDGLWSKDGDRWVIKSTGVLKDGRAVSATNLLTRVNRDSLKWASVDRTLDNEVLPDAEEVTLVRTPPMPRPAPSNTQPRPARRLPQ